MARGTLLMIGMIGMVAAVAVSACGDDVVPPPPETPSPPAVAASTSPGRTVSATPDQTSADAATSVSLRTVQAWLSWDTTVDHRPNDTSKRLALRWLTPRLQQQVRAIAGDPSADARWATWARHRARASVRTTAAADDRPADSAGTAQRQVEATVTLTGSDGWTETLYITAFLTLRHADTRWLVDGLSTDTQ